MNKHQLEMWLEDTSLFRKELRKLNNPKELYDFLLQITQIKGYKLFIPNRWYMPVEHVTVRENGSVSLYFYLAGGRTYKTLKGFYKKVELTTCDTYDSFTLDYYN